MATAFSGVEKLPVWQRLVVWVVVSAAIAAVWWFLFYVDAVAAREGAEQGLAKATAELDRLEKRKENFLQEQREHEENEVKLRERMEVLPMSASTVDHLMQTFQQKARQVGLSFDSWTNDTPQRLEEFSERLPIKVKARGTWPQIGEFFRQLSELGQIVSVENISMGDAAEGEPGAHPVLKVSFEAVTYRFLSEEERSATPAKTTRREPSRRKGASQ